MGIFLDKTKKVLFGLRIVTIAVAVIIWVGFAIIPTGNLPLCCVWAFLLGFEIFQILPSAYGFANTVTGTIKPAVANGLMMSAAFVYALLASLIATALIN